MKKNYFEPIAEVIATEMQDIHTVSVCANGDGDRDRLDFSKLDVFKLH